MKRPPGETQLFVWYDYFSCPQEDRTNLHAAISSIPAYIESCKYFVILAPLSYLGNILHFTCLWVLKPNKELKCKLLILPPKP